VQDADLGYGARGEFAVRPAELADEKIRGTGDGEELPG
jgi:hypothetical protein